MARPKTRGSLIGKVSEGRRNSWAEPRMTLQSRSVQRKQPIRERPSVISIRMFLFRRVCSLRRALFRGPTSRSPGGGLHPFSSSTAAISSPRSALWEAHNPGTRKISWLMSQENMTSILQNSVEKFELIWEPRATYMKVALLSGKYLSNCLFSLFLFFFVS